MNRFLLKKGLILFGSLFLVIVTTFFLMHAIPGDPFLQDKAIPEEILQSMRAYYGLDQPLYVQFGKYLEGVLHGNLGPSFKYEGRTVNDIIASGFPISCYLGLEALLIAVAGGVFLGSVAALYHKRSFDYMTMVIAVIGISVPSFILATFLQYIFAMKLSLLPVARWGSFAHTIMPAIALSALPLAFIARLTRSSMIEVLHQDYIQTARSKGLSGAAIIWKHAFRNALLPVVTYIGPLLAGIMTGSFAIEKIFGIPGLGQWFVLSITNRDYTVIMGLTIFYSALLLFCIFVVDLIYCLIDPRLKGGRDG
ncbi:MAG: oligopeptide transport system permease protein oppB [Chlamydiota bacterium]|jgi:oligopeptide transport system permease protein